MDFQHKKATIEDLKIKNILIGVHYRDYRKFSTKTRISAKSNKVVPQFTSYILQCEEKTQHI